MTSSVSIARYIPALRRATELAIKLDPRSIALIPSSKVRTASGAYDYQDQTPRATQTFTLESNSSTLTGISATSGGTTESESGASAKHWYYYLVGRYDAIMEIGDYWIDGNTTYTIKSIQPKNDYERRAIVEAVGDDPNYG